MRRRPVSFDKATLVSHTFISKSRVDSILELARKLTEDPDRKQRLHDQKCKACFYQSGFGGAAMTSQPCGACGKDIMYGSTNTSAFCQPCAEEHDLCRHCGGDIELRVKRRNWPAALRGE